MNAQLKKLMTVLLMAVLVFPVLFPVYANAAIKLNATSKTMSIGDTYALKVSGTKSKVSWSSNNKTIANVTATGKVVALKEGKAIITAKVESKSYKCTITVLSNVSDPLNNISYETKETRKGIVLIATNKNPFPVDLDGKAVFLDKKGSMLDTSSDYVYCLEENQTCALFFHGATDSDYNYIKQDSYKVNLMVEKTYPEKYAASKIKVKSNIGSENVTAEFKNGSKYDLDSISVAIVFYDAEKNVIGYNDNYLQCKKAGSTDYITFSFPYTEDYETIYPDSYEIYVNSAYCY